MWIIYFCCYISSGTNHVEADIAGVFVIYKDSARTYLYPYQYITWKIDSTDWIEGKPEHLERGTFYLSRPYGSSVLIINRIQIHQYVVFQKGETVHRDFITAKRRHRYKR